MVRVDHGRLSISLTYAPRRPGTCHRSRSARAIDQIYDRAMPTVQLFVTCLGDLVFPEAVADAEALLRAAGFDVVVPEAQVCCGQPAFNAGHRQAARRVARVFARASSRDAPMVAASGSGGTEESPYRPNLVGVEPFE